MTTVDTPPARTLLRQPMFRRYWSASAVSLIGDQISLLAIPLLALSAPLFATPAEMGYLTAAGLAPHLAFSLLAGAWVDRQRHRRYVMIAADIARAALLISIPTAAALHLLGMSQLYVVAFLVGTCASFFDLASSTLFVSVVKPQEYVPANTLLNGARAASFAVGPSIGGILVQAISAPVALLADAASFLASAVLLRRVRVAEPEPETARTGQVTAGLRFLAGSRSMSSILLSVATVNLFNFIFAALSVLYFTQYLDLTPAMLGLILGAASAGALLGSLITGRLVRAIGVGPAYVVGLLAFPAPLILVPAAGGPLPVVAFLVFVAEFFCGLGVMILDIAAGSLLAALSPLRLRARVMGAFRTVNYGIRPVGALLGGALGGAIGVRSTLWIGTLGALLGVLWLIGSPVVRLRTLPEPPP